MGRWIRISTTQRIMKRQFKFAARHKELALIGLLLVQLAALAETNQPTPPAKIAEPKTAAAISLVQLRGKVVCLPEEMHERYQAAFPSAHEHLYGLKSVEGKYYTLLRSKFSEALFVDQRFREKELLLKGRIFPGSQVFETVTIRSIRNGVVCDLYYYCDICDIQAVAPGPCECCQGPTELLEKPLGD